MDAHNPKNTESMITEESEMVKICAMISPHTPRELCTTAEGVAWLVERFHAGQKALRKLEEIRTEKLAACGLTVEASAVSAARVILQSQRVAAAKADEKPDGQAENVPVVAPATLEPESKNDGMAG